MSEGGLAGSGTMDATEGAVGSLLTWTSACLELCAGKELSVWMVGLVVTGVVAGKLLEVAEVAALAVVLMTPIEVMVE